MHGEAQERGEVVEFVGADLLDLENTRGYHDDKHDIEDGVSQLHFPRHRKSDHARDGFHRNHSQWGWKTKTQI